MDSGPEWPEAAVVVAQISRELGTKPGLTVMEDSVDLLSNDLALRCGDRGQASEREAVGASLAKSCGREQPPISMAQGSLGRHRGNMLGSSSLLEQGSALSRPHSRFWDDPCPGTLGSVEQPFLVISVLALPNFAASQVTEEESRHFVSNKETGKKDLGTAGHRRGRWARGWRSLGGGQMRSDGPCGPSRE